MLSKYKISKIDGRDYVSVNDAKKILGVSTAKELRSLGAMTVAIDNQMPLWSLNWIIGQAKRADHAQVFIAPDDEWISEYEINRRLLETRSKATLSETTSMESMKSRLNELVKLMPPPNEVPCNTVEWPAVENVIGASYPQSFKEFIAVYGALQWFDWLQPLVPFEDMSVDDFRRFLLNTRNEHFAGTIKAASGEPLEVPEFGDCGFWLPFMTGSDGDVYAWVVDGDPDEWNLICVVNRRARLIPAVSISEMLAGWLLGESLMEDTWGSVDEFREHSPHRLTMLD